MNPLALEAYVPPAIRYVAYCLQEDGPLTPQEVQV